jgi:sortase A
MSGVYVPLGSKRPSADLPYSRVKIAMRRHIIPPMMGLFVMFSVLGMFNAQYISGQIAYRMNASRVEATSPVTETATTAPVDINAPAKITINKIAVDAPIIFGLPDNEEPTFQEALRGGVVHYPQTALPGEQGNSVIFGHSSDVWWAPGDYKFVFALLEKLEIDDIITVSHKGVNYTYVVEGKRIVEPDDISVLQPTEGHRLTLITCTPTGTNEKRLIIDAAQVYPKPVEAMVSPQSQTLDVDGAGNKNQAAQSLPSQASSFWEGIFNRF